jgi:hypothetical protein
MLAQAIWTLEMKRRENDRKILALHLEMRDMIAVLVQYVTPENLSVFLH